MPTSCLPMRPLLPKPMRMRPLLKLKPMRMRLLPKFKPMQIQMLPMPNFPLPVMVSLLAIIGPTSKVVVVVVLVTMAAVMVLVTMAALVALVMVVAETVVEAWIDKARINFVFLLSTKIGNTYTYTRHVIDSKKRESQSVESENRVSRYSTTSSSILYHKSVVTKGTDQFLFLRHNNIT